MCLSKDQVIQVYLDPVPELRLIKDQVKLVTGACVRTMSDLILCEHCVWLEPVSELCLTWSCVNIVFDLSLCQKDVWLDPVWTLCLTWSCVNIVSDLSLCQEDVWVEPCWSLWNISQTGGSTHFRPGGHKTLYNVHCTLPCILDVVQGTQELYSILYSVECTVCSVWCTVYSVKCTVYIVKRRYMKEPPPLVSQLNNLRDTCLTCSTVHCALYTVQCALYTMNCDFLLYNVYSSE